MDIIISSSEVEKDPEYDTPQGSKWVVAIGIDGSVIILKAPNIHPHFFDEGMGAEVIGLPFECEDTKPGVYEWVCSFHVSRDWESGVVDGWVFHVENETLLYCIE